MLYNKEIDLTPYRYKIIRYQDYLLAKEEEVNPEYQWIESILVFLFPYPEKRHEAYGYLPAKFAYGKDYHQVVKQKLEEIAKNLELNRYEVLVDQSFLDEKAVAVLAGLGEIGRNNLLLTQEFGSRVFIGEIVTDKKLITSAVKQEQAFSNVCLHCNLCVEHCPTKALVDGFDKSKCLSFLSQKVSNDYHLYDKMECYYGCDICQDVCPLNQKEYEYLEEFEYHEDSCLNLTDIIDLTNEEFARKYHHKAFNWIPVKRMIRNLLVLEANNNKLSIKDIEYFQKKFYNTDWLVDHLTYLKGRIQRGKH